MGKFGAGVVGIGGGSGGLGGSLGGSGSAGTVKRRRMNSVTAAAVVKKIGLTNRTIDTIKPSVLVILVDASIPDGIIEER